MNIEVVRGDSKTLEFTVIDNGIALNITGYTAFFTVKKKYDTNATDSSALIKKTWTGHGSPTTGVTSITLTASDTDIEPGKYVFDLQLKNGSSIVSTKQGDFTVYPDITRRTS